MKKWILFLMLIASFGITHLSAQSCLMSNIAAGQPVGSSRPNDGPATNAVDGNLTTAWTPVIDGDEWIYVDLGQNYTLCKVVLLWNDWKGQDTFKVQFSTDTTNWTDLAYNTASPVAGPTGADYQMTTVDLSASTMSGRYLRIYLYNVSGWNIQMLELQAYAKLPLSVPSVSLTAPADGANYTEGDSVVLQATASDSGGTISQVQYYQGTTLLGSSTTLPYTFAWKQVPEGEYVVTAKATDIYGYSAASTPINVYVDFPLPAWSMTGNKGTNGDSNFLGTIDSTKLVFRTDSLKRMTILPNGNIGIAIDTPVARLHIAGTVNDPVKRPAFMVYPNGDLAAGTTMDRSVTTTDQAGLRYYSKLGILQLGATDRLDTTVSKIVYNNYEGSGILINSDDSNTIKGRIYASILAGDQNRIDSAAIVSDSYVAGEAHHLGTAISNSVISGWGNRTSGVGDFNSCIVGGFGNSFPYFTHGLIAGGYINNEVDTSGYSLISGWYNTYGGMGQLVSGGKLINRSPFGTTLGYANVDFSTLPYQVTVPGSNVTSLDQYPVFALGNSSDINGVIRSNAMTVLYNGRTQINTTGLSTSLTQTAVTPKAALEVVSTNSGVLLPKLTTTQRNGIVSGDLQNGLLLYNTDSSQFQFYNGISWTAIGSGSGTGSGWSLNGNTGSNPATSFIGTTDNEPLVFKTNSVKRITVLGSGSVIIGDTAQPASDALFAVNGNAYVKKLFVTLTGWPDYVFHKEYKLPGLPEVERYIA
ncbi:MAG: discoidin domain-containing protein, partial [Puia sp.]|nr:discoidin domain-containing protein [Puia sp.]